jgi:hypothetical protein
MTHADDREGIDFGGPAPTVQVLVYRDGALIHRELCESAEAASDTVDEWEEEEGVECVVEDLGVTHVAGQILEPEPDITLADEDYR